MIVLVGKSCSGKDSIGKELEKLGIKKCVTYTTRPPRPNEVNGVDYHFISTDCFEKLVGKNFFAEWRIYKTEQGVWLYGSAKKNYVNDDYKYIILTPSGLNVVKTKDIDNVSFYIDADDEIILNRMKKRDKDLKESKRRFLADVEDFKGIEDKVDFIISNNGMLSTLEIAEMIKYAIIGRKEI